MQLVKNINMLRQPELRKLVKQFDSLTDTTNGYSCYRQNANTLKRLLDKIMVLAKEEKEWYLYFNALHEVFFVLDRIDGKSKEMLKYAEIYYRDINNWAKEGSVYKFDYVEWPDNIDDKLSVENYIRFYLQDRIITVALTLYGKAGPESEEWEYIEKSRVEIPLDIKK